MAKEVKHGELVAKFNELLEKVYKKELMKASNRGDPIVIESSKIYDSDLSELLLTEPERFFGIGHEALEQIELPNPVKLKVGGIDVTNVRDLRSRHIGKFTCVDGIVRRASEIRPEIVETTWECLDCNEMIDQPRKTNVVFKPLRCPKCGKQGFKQISKKMIDTRWITIEEPFELTEGERPSQLNVLLTEDLVSPEGRRLSDPGNRIKVTGILREIPKGKYYSVKLDFYLDSNFVEPVEIGLQHLEITKEDEKEIKKMAKDPLIYDKLVDSLAPSLYGMKEIKESIILQLFGGVQRTLKDGTKFRGDVHILLIGDPSSGKSQLMKLVPQIVPRGKYVSGKGVTGAGLCMSYDTLVPLAHGEIRKIGDIVEGVLLKGKKRIKGGWVSEKGNVEVICLDHKNLKLKRKSISKFFKLKPNGGIIELKTNSGRNIKVTEENPLLIIRNGELEWRKANEIKNGDYIALARKIPVNHLPIDMKPEFARFVGMIVGDGDIGQREMRFHNTNEKYLNEFSGLSTYLGFRPRKYYQKSRVPCIRVASKILCDQLENMGVPRGVKCDKVVIPDDILRSDKLLSEFLSGLFTCDGGPVEKGNGSYIEYTTTSNIIAKQIQTALLRFGILSKLRVRNPSKKGFGGKKKKYVIIIRGQENLREFKERIGFSYEKGEKLMNILKKDLKPNTNVDIIPNIGSKLREIRKSTGIKIKNDEFLYMLRTYETGRRKFSRDQLIRFVRELKKKKDHAYFDFLERLAKSDIFWDRIVEKNYVEEDWVYDLTIDDEHNFVANDMIVHNTATVTKDEQFMGGWVLEAGALVLTNKGLLAIDEFEKMSQDDQIAMHEALEQGSISIAKASIVATLPAQTSVLAGGNPKFSRFDPYMPIVKQITIPDTLLTRFDLKFALRDVPESEMDKKIVDHVLKTREDDFEGSRPKISQEMVRKYIAYTKQHCQPTVTPEAGKILRRFYLNTRKRAEGGGGPIPITLRQFEALMRLSEASARIQLSDEVRREDAQRAIRLMRFSLRQLGFDTETGQIDIDRAEGASVTSSERSRIRMVMDIINDLSEKTREIAVAEIQKLARKEGVEEVDDIIEKLKREGLLFEPNPGYVQKV
jgi:replicative DNA helicase Mcm